MNLDLIFILLIVFQFKHFIADYPLQTPYMLGKFKDKGWVLPLASHCAVHFLFTFFIVGLTLRSSTSNQLGLTLMFGLAVLDFMIHFIMDRIKASPKLLGRYEAISKEQFKGLVESRQICISAIEYGRKSHLGLENKGLQELARIDNKFKSNTYFWYSLGLDQMVHHLTDILIIYILVQYV